MKIHRHVEDLLGAGDRRAYIASQSGFLKAVKVGTPGKPIHGYFISKLKERPGALEPVDPQIILMNYIPVPALILAKATTIFRHVYEKYDRAEMIVLLRWKEIDLGNGRKIGRYYLDRAERVEVAAAGLDYLQNVPIVGSIHSHSDFGAGFSNVDDRWERDRDAGIYITIGNVDRKNPSIETSVGGLGVRQIIPSPDVPEEVMNCVKLTDEELDWWTETLTVKRYNRYNGYYICVGDTVMGWTPDNNTPELHQGEKVVPVQTYHEAQKKRDDKKPKTVKHKRVIRIPRGPGAPQTTVDDSSFTWKQFKYVTNFINFLKKRDLISEFVYLLLQEVNELETEEISRLLDMHLEELESRKEDEKWKESSFWGAGGLGTTLGSPSDDFWRA